MRLICPNCGAQYEVDDAAIPDQGRDVQCSNCGHTWFQRPAHLDADLAEELQDESAVATEEADTAEEAPQPRGLDPDVADVLREEAERESAARKAEAEALESQPDLGLDEAAREAANQSAAAARARMARLRGQEDPASDAEALAAVAAAAGKRRELLPDIEEINSTLRSSEDRKDGPDEVEGEETAAPRKSSGFRTGFLLVLIVFVAGLLLYSLAPQIVATVPQTEPYMIQYVDWANGLRETVNSAIDTAMSRINGLIGG